MKLNRVETKALEELNLLTPSAAATEFLKCCGSREWAGQMAIARPFASLKEMGETAERVWWALTPADWLEAFRSHPKIGERKAAAQVSAEASSWSAREQASISSATSDTMDSLADLNQKYLEKFGYIFIVCATGKSSEEMLALLRTRMQNDPESELRTAAGEQAKITQLRLTKLVTSSDG